MINQSSEQTVHQLPSPCPQFLSLQLTQGHKDTAAAFLTGWLCPAWLGRTSPSCCVGNPGCCWAPPQMQGRF